MFSSASPGDGSEPADAAAAGPSSASEATAPMRRLRGVVRMRPKLGARGARRVTRRPPARHDRVNALTARGGRICPGRARRSNRHRPSNDAADCALVARTFDALASAPTIGAVRRRRGDRLRAEAESGAAAVAPGEPSVWRSVAVNDSSGVVGSATVINSVGVVGSSGVIGSAGVIGAAGVVGFVRCERQRAVAGSAAVVAGAAVALSIGVIGSAGMLGGMANVGCAGVDQELGAG